MFSFVTIGESEDICPGRSRDKTQSRRRVAVWRLTPIDVSQEEWIYCLSALQRRCSAL